MSNNLENEIQKLAQVIRRAEKENPRVAGNAVADAFRENIRVHKGLHHAGGVVPFLQRRFTARRRQGKNMVNLTISERVFGSPAYRTECGACALSSVFIIVK